MSAQLTQQQEAEVVAKLTALSPSTNYLDQAVVAIINLLRCSQDEALIFLRNLQDRNEIEAVAESYAGVHLTDSVPLHARKWIKVEKGSM